MQTRQTQKLDFQDQYFQKFKTRIFSTVHPRRFETLENRSERCKTRSEPASNRLKSGTNKNEKIEFLRFMTFFHGFSQFAYILNAPHSSGYTLECFVSFRKMYSGKVAPKWYERPLQTDF